MKSHGLLAVAMLGAFFTSSILGTIHAKAESVTPRFSFVSGAIDENMIVAALNHAKTSIDIQAYELSDPLILRAIINAKYRKVSVHVSLDESDSFSRRVNQPTVLLLKNSGIFVKTLSFSQNIDHVKMIDVDGGKEVISGSMNFGAHSWNNIDGSLWAYNVPTAVSQWLTSGNTSKHGYQLAGVKAPSPLETPGNYESSIVKAINHAKSISIAMNILTSRNVLDALKTANHKHVPIVLWLDASSKFDRKVNRNAENFLVRNHIGFHLYASLSHFGLLHEKWMVIDHQVIFTGSSNWTSSGFWWNGELDWRFSDRKLALNLEHSLLTL